ncbi:Type IV pilus assembly PilZ domain protein [Candidatus Magnetomoraceae bacterium gMMP-15]
MNNKDKRSEPRFTIDRYYSVEFLISGMGCLYQCKLWNISKKGICILIKENSSVIKHFNTKDVLKMRYYKDGDNYPTDYLKTIIRHITLKTDGRFKGHYLIGLEILEGDHSIPIP